MNRKINSLSVNLFGSNKNQPLIFIHGFPFDHTLWEKQINYFEKKYFCIAYDVRGLGKSYVGDGQYTMEAYVNDLYSIIDELKLNKPVLIGHSMGGYITLRALEQQRIEFSGAVLCNTKAEADSDVAKLNRAEKIDLINTKGIKDFIVDFVPPCFAPETEKEQPKVYKAIFSKALTNNPVGVKGALIAMLSRTSTDEFISRTKLPVLLIAGAFDKLMHPVVLRKMSEKIKNSTFSIAPRAGHMAPAENTDFVNEMMEGFLNGLK